MLYEVKLKRGYLEMEFMFGYKKDALRFMEWSKMYNNTHDEDGNLVELKVTMEIKGCAESGNSETAHLKEQIKNSTEQG